MTGIMMLGALELILLPGGQGILGMPPGERDSAMVKVAPADSLVYLEWASRTSGKRGGKGIDGFFGDPEINALFKALDRNIAAMIKREARGREEQALAKLYPLAKLLIKHPGCVYAKYDGAFAKKLMENSRNPEMLLFGARAALVINTRTDAKAVEKQIAEMLSTLAPGDAEITKLDNFVVPIGLPREMPQLYLHRHQTYIIAAFGKDTLTDAIAGLEGKRSGLGANDRFTSKLKPLLMDRTGQVTWIDLKGGIAQAKVVLGERADQIIGFAQLLGLDGLDASVSVTGVDDQGRVVSKSELHTGGKFAGVLSLFSGRALTKDDYKRVPADADLVISFSLDLKKGFSELRRILKIANRDAAEGLENDIQAIEEELGIKIDDLFEAFGDKWVLHDSPSAGGVLVTSLVASLEVKDPKKAYAIFTQLMKILNASLPGEMDNRGRRRRGIFLANQKFMDRTIYFVNIVGDDIPFAPAFCVTDKELLVAPTPVALKAHLRFLKHGKRTFADRLGNGGEQIAFPAGETIGFSYYHAKSVTRLLYALVPYFGQIGLSEAQGWGEWDMTVFDIPSARAILPYVSNGIASMTRTKNGLRFESKGGLPVAGGGSLILSVPLMGAMLFVAEERAIQNQRLRFRAIEKKIQIQGIEGGFAPPQIELPQLEVQPLPIFGRELQLQLKP